MSLILDIHALHTIPPSNINRDDTGAPKSAVFGGVPRQRVSSQAWKRAIRREFENTLGQQNVGYRTKHAAEKVQERLTALASERGVELSADQAAAAVKALFAAAKIKLITPKAKEGEAPGADQTGYLLFLSSRQIDRAAELLLSLEGAKPKAADAKDVLDTHHSIDIAMFGRMLADAPDYNVDASVQVAHALGVHESEPEFDYFTAVDDVVEDNEETGAGMIGTVQMMSSTLYRYATVNLDGLRENLGDEDAVIPSVVAFVNAFITSMPTGKINTFANQTLPELVYVAVRNDRPISLVNAFEEPVAVGDDRGRRVQAAAQLAHEARQIHSAYGFDPVATFVLGTDEMKSELAGLGEDVSLRELPAALEAALAESSGS